MTNSRPKTFNEQQQLKLRIEFESLARYKAKMVQVRINLTDVEHECEHGALPLDRRKPRNCFCWSPAAVAALANRVQDNPDFSDAA
jgi:hypothetical protein